jgi:hypothetical protein
MCFLKKSLYGLKQAPRARYAKMDSFLLDNNISRCHSNPNVYTKKIGSQLIILVSYVDDLILTTSDPKLLTHVKPNCKRKFEIDLQVLQTKEGIYFSNLSMHVTFFVVIRWKIVNEPLLPSILWLNLLPPTLHPK